MPRLAMAMIVRPFLNNEPLPDFFGPGINRDEPVVKTDDYGWTFCSSAGLDSPGGRFQFSKSKSK